MKKLINVAALAIIAGLAAVYFFLGPSVLFGGPSKSAIIDGARQVLIATAPGTAEADQARAAEITPRGLCNAAPDGGHACIVDLKIGADAASPFVVILRKGPDGSWIASQ